MNEKNRAHLLRPCAATALLNELSSNNSRARSSAASDEAVVAGIEVEGELPGFPDVESCRTGAGTHSLARGSLQHTESCQVAKRRYPSSRRPLRPCFRQKPAHDNEHSVRVADALVGPPPCHAALAQCTGTIIAAVKGLDNRFGRRHPGNPGSPARGRDQAARFALGRRRRCLRWAPRELATCHHPIKVISL